MAKKTGTKHHVIIKLSDLNKMFKNDEVIPIPKAFAKDIAYLLAAHSVSLNEVDKTTKESVYSNTVSETVSENIEPQDFKQELNKEDETPIQFSISE